MKYKIFFKGITIVEAETAEEAKKQFEDGEYLVRALGTSDPEEISEAEFKEICEVYNEEESEAVDNG